MGRRILTVLGVAVLACGVQACKGAQVVTIELAGPHAPPGQLSVDGRSNAHVTLAADGRRVAAAWIASSEAGADVFAAISEDSAETFGPPVRVNDLANDAGGNGEQPPRVVLKGNDLTVVWVSKRDGVSGIRTAQSSDGGRTFGKTRTISPDGVTGARGWHSAAIGDDGTMHAVWLDGRHASPSPKGAKHSHGAMRQDIVHAMWRDGEGVVETTIAENVCFCCKTGVAVRGKDVFIVWRHIFPGGMRDIAIARSNDGGRTFSQPARVSADNWKIDACPDDGPALAFDGEGAIHVVWPTLVQEDGSPQMMIFEAVSTDGGVTFSPRIRVGAWEKGASHPRVAVVHNERSIIPNDRKIVWDSMTEEGRRVMLGAGGLPAVLGEGTSAGYPAIVALADRFALAWTEQAAGRSVIRVTWR